MDLNTFLDHFDTIAEAPGGIAKLKALILDLAVRGKLVPQNLEDESAEVLRNQIIVEKQELEKSKKIAKQRSVIPVQETELPYAIPNNWSWCRWNDVALHIGDIDHKMPTEVSEGIPYVSPRNFKGANIIDFEGAKKISLEDFERLKIKVQPTKGDIIFPRYGTIGENRLVEVDINFLASYSCAIVKNLHGYIEPKYSYYYSLSKLVKSEIERYTNKTTQANVGIQSIQNFVYPLPPLAEQKRIVKKVDELMTLCDRLAAAKQTRDNLRQKLRGSAIAALMNAGTDEALEKSWAIVRDNWHSLSQDPKDVDDLRRSVLQLGVRGRLSLRHSDDEPVEFLLDQSEKDRDKLLSQGKIRNQKKQLLTNELPWMIPDHWAAVPVNLLAFSYDHLRMPINKDERVIRKGNVPYYGANGQVGWIDTPLFNDDLVLVVEDETFIGRTKPFSYLISGSSWVNNHAHVLKPSSAIRPKFLNFVLMYYPFAPLTSGTTGRRKLTQPTLMGIEIPLPPLNEQVRIIQKIEQFWSLCDQLEASLRQSQQRASALAASAISHLTL